MTINLDDYEKAIVKLALRQFATSSFQKAVTALKAGDNKNGTDETLRGETASAVADKFDAS
jgi:hypothetical protein